MRLRLLWGWTHRAFLAAFPLSLGCFTLPKDIGFGVKDGHCSLLAACNTSFISNNYFAILDLIDKQDRYIDFAQISFVKQLPLAKSQPIPLFVAAFRRMPHLCATAVRAQAALHPMSCTQ